MIAARELRKPQDRAKSKKDAEKNRTTLSRPNLGTIVGITMRLWSLEWASLPLWLLQEANRLNTWQISYRSTRRTNGDHIHKMINSKLRSAKISTNFVNIWSWVLWNTKLPIHDPTKSIPRPVSIEISLKVSASLASFDAVSAQRCTTIGFKTLEARSNMKAKRKQTCREDTVISTSRMSCFVFQSGKDNTNTKEPMSSISKSVACTKHTNNGKRFSFDDHNHNEQPTG